VSRVLLIYPFFRRPFDRSRFRFPPLGLAYLAATLRRDGHAVELLDCTFLTRREALERARAACADIVGVSCLATMEDEALLYATQLREQTQLLVAGGPLPSCDPGRFLPPFDAVVKGEGEVTMAALVAAHEEGCDLTRVPGVVSLAGAGSVAGLPDPECAPPDPLAAGAGGRIVAAPPRPFIDDLDDLPMPARHLLPNSAYIRYGRRRHGFAVTTVMSTRGCPFDCEFCSNTVFGRSYRERSPENVIDEVEQALRLGYDRIAFADDVFTLRRERVRAVCEEILRRGLRFSWECLGRVDSLDEETARLMHRAGCGAVFFGIESGDDGVLELMDKRITAAQARAAVLTAKRADLEVGAFFILFYPGETDDSVLETLRFATSLPLDYLGLTMPYPLPGSRLTERVGDRMTRRWRQREGLVPDQVLTYDGDFSQAKMRFGIAKGQLQWRLAQRLGVGSPVLRLVERPTDRLLRTMR
jgi:anaerobic magnesium-protoporphyrin IX monomethyl ester cyclase